jgi:hypothetical protein
MIIVIALLGGFFLFIGVTVTRDLMGLSRCRPRALTQRYRSTVRSVRHVRPQLSTPTK